MPSIDMPLEQLLGRQRYERRDLRFLFHGGYTRNYILVGAPSTRDTTDDVTSQLPEIRLLDARICDQRAGNFGRLITISAAGRASVAPATCP